MPLSEHEQRQLEQIEQALYADYPKLAQAVRARDPRVHYKRRLLAAVAGFIVGAGVLVADVVLRRFFPWIAIGGLVVMLVCGTWALSSWRHMGGVHASRARAGRARAKRRAPAASHGFSGGRRPRVTGRATFMERLEERWRRRQEGGL